MQFSAAAIVAILASFTAAAPIESKSLSSRNALPPNCVFVNGSPASRKITCTGAAGARPIVDTNLRGACKKTSTGVYCHLPAEPVSLTHTTTSKREATQKTDAEEAYVLHNEWKRDEATIKREAGEKQTPDAEEAYKLHIEFKREEKEMNKRVESQVPDAEEAYKLHIEFKREEQMSKRVENQTPDAEEAYTLHIEW